jgi:hypothetical protein
VKLAAHDFRDFRQFLKMVSRTPSPSRHGRADVMDGLEKYFLSNPKVLGRGHYADADAETLRYAYMKPTEWRLAMGISAGSEFGWISLWAYPIGVYGNRKRPSKTFSGIAREKCKGDRYWWETTLLPRQRKASHRCPTENNMLRASR